ncbi:mechanosensitive ion channel family protein [Paraglaciecola aquimarina]|uniref:Small-conductance mechanosensitive channel n=1 Tax=Paraglaciecola aquimarina TaxID=1235557 RepID=A0ABU3SSE2_9ALTE|nr:mechanosensitive ion channel family protein [Paraglaciecola aquimarina]MDU0352936.1 mechanosensitive ion channel family protein [Paraglaciecola aquimarina]
MQLRSLFVLLMLFVVPCSFAHADFSFLLSQPHSWPVSSPLELANVNTEAPSVLSSDEGFISAETSLIWQDLQNNWQLFLQKLPTIGLGFLLLVVIVLLARPLSELFVRPITFVSSSQLIRLVTRRLISVLFILFGLYLFLRFAGLSEFAVAVLSGTGVIGLIIGFAFKDIAENFISSLLLSIQKPFKIDDIIEVEGRLGVVKQVTARATTLVDFDGDHVQIPNAIVYKNIIRNLTANPKSRGSFVIGIGYDSSIIESQKLALNILQSTDAVLTEPEPQVLVDVLASSTVNLKVYFWVNVHEHSLLKVGSYLMRAIMREFEKQGINMPDDAREVIFPQGIAVHQADGLEAKQRNASNANNTNPNDQPRLRRAAVDWQNNEQQEDLASDVEDIRQQAKEATDPEKGQNIL